MAHGCTPSPSTHHAADVVLDAGRGEEHLAQVAAVRLLVGAADAGQLRVAKICVGDVVFYCAPCKISTTIIVSCSRQLRTRAAGAACGAHPLADGAGALICRQDALARGRNLLCVGNQLLRILQTTGSISRLVLRRRADGPTAGWAAAREERTALGSNSVPLPAALCNPQGRSGIGAA